MKNLTGVMISPVGSHSSSPLRGSRPDPLHHLLENVDAILLHTPSKAVHTFAAYLQKMGPLKKVLRATYAVAAVGIGGAVGSFNWGRVVEVVLGMEIGSKLTRIAAVSPEAAKITGIVMGGAVGLTIASLALWQDYHKDRRERQLQHELETLRRQTVTLAHLLRNLIERVQADKNGSAAPEIPLHASENQTYTG